MLKSAFPPSVDADTRLLVLGSLPGEESLRRGEYYAHPTNAFWWLIGEVIGRPMVGLPYAARLDALRAAHVGLWDTIERAERRGSLDTAIKSAEPRDLAALAATLPNLRAIAFNGGTSARIGRRQSAGVEGYALIDLPSSSAAHAGRTRAQKQELWLGLRSFL